MIHTSFVPLERPYQIVEYQGTLGIQIGTLIVTVDKSEESDDGYSIETHSHPVVSYVNNKKHKVTKYSKSLSMPRPYEGVVWDKVELYQLRPFAREEEQISWSYFMDFCCRWRMAELEGKLQNVDATIMDNYGMLLDWGIEIGNPKGLRGRSWTLVLEVNDYLRYGENEYLTIGGDMGIAVRKEDPLIMAYKIFAQAEFFLSFMDYIDLPGCKLKFWTENMFMQDFTKDLNEQWRKINNHKMSYNKNEFNNFFSAAVAAEELNKDE